MVEKGADLVVCQHSHCVGAYEEYKEATIVYGQGNFIFNELDNEYWNSSVLIDVKIQDKLSVNYIPIVMTQKGIRLAKDRDKENILGSFKRRSEEILVEGFIEKEYEAFAKKNSDYYLRRFLGFNNWIVRIDRRIFRGYLLKRKTEQSYLLAVQNYIECESHRELLLMGLVQDRKDEKGR
jgi:poly-gamma-glutamate synthesis protein (capsule biosynthesis protein)